MNIVANGKAYELPERATLEAFLQDQGQRLGMVVVERNGEALPPSRAKGVVLQDGDRLEIARIVAGG